MAIGELTAVDGQAVGAAETVRLLVPAGSDYGLTARSEWHERHGIGATHHGQTPEPRQIPLVAVPGSAAAGSNINVWQGAVMALLRPTGALRTLTADLDGAEVAIEVAIEQVTSREGLPVVQATALAPSQFWRTTGALNSDTTGTATNNGNAPAAPKITIRPTTGTVVRWRVTLVDVSSRGLKDHPLRMVINTNGIGVAGGADILLFDRGQSVPFQAIAPPSATTPIFFLCSLLPNENTFVDVVCGSAVNNVVTANQLDPAGMDWAHASFTNTNWVYRGTPGTLNGLYAPAWWETARAPRRPGAWHRTEFGARDPSSGWTEIPANNQIAIIGHGAITVVTQIKAGTSNAITGMGISSTSLWSADNLQYRRAGEWAWSTGTSTATGSVGSPKELTVMDADDAVQLLIQSVTGAIALNQFDADPIVVLLQSGEAPTISVAGSSVAMARINGTLTNTTTGDQIVFEDVYIDADASGGLIVDTNAAPGEQARIYPSLSTSPLYTASTGRGVRFTNRAGWPLVPGANAWSWSGDGAPVITVQHADAWAV